jgi:very-short-patch-repair endonuclease
LRSEVLVDRALRFFGGNRAVRPEDREAVERIARYLDAEETRRERRDRADAPWKSDFGAAVKSSISGTQSPVEELLVRELARYPGLLGAFDTQIPVGPYTLDIGFPAVRLCVAVDGRWHRLEPAQMERDQFRDEYLARLGWLVVRVTGAEVRRSAARCVERIMRVYGAMRKVLGVRP